MIAIDNGKIVVDHSDMIKDGQSLKSIFPFAKWKNGKWEMLATYQNVDCANRVFQTNLSIEKPASEVPNVTQFLLSTNYKSKVKPYQHQLEALSVCNRRKYFAYFLEPGLGKTKITIDDAMVLYNDGKVDTVLVVCPLSAVFVWINEIRKNVGNDAFVSAWPDKPIGGDGIRWYVINHDALVAGHVNLGKTIKKLKDTNGKIETEKVIEKIHQLKNNTGDGFGVSKQFLLSSSRCMMVIDESSVICNFDSLRTQYCTKLGGMAEYRRILTGDPIANNPIDLYSQLNWLSPDTVENRSFYSFRGHFCDMGGYKGKQIVGYKNLNHLKAIYNANGHRVKTSDVLDMPPQNWVVRKITPKDSIRGLYNDIVEKDVVPFLDKFENSAMIDVSYMLVQFTKLQQVCGGTLIDDDGKAHVVNTQKLKELMIMIDEWNIPGVLIWYHFKAEGKMIAEALAKKNKSFANYSGGLSVKGREQTISDFENGVTDYLIIQDDAGYSSITLNKASYSVYFSNHLRPLVRNQSERRNWRIGQTKPVFYYDILFDGFIDSWIYDRLKRKKDFNSAITDTKMTKEEIKKLFNRR